jgi:hypothetical protein
MREQSEGEEQMVRRAVRPVMAIAVGSAALLLAGAIQAVASPEDHAVRNTGIVMTLPTGTITYFDISWVDQSTGKYFLSDDSNNAIDMFDAKTDSFVRFLAKGQFAGTGIAACYAFTPDPYGCAGPTGVLTDNLGRAWAGDSPTATDPQSGVEVINTATAPYTFTRIDTGGHTRSDELSFDPADHMILIANPDDGFLTWISTTTLRVVGKFYYSGNADGVTPTLANHPAPQGLEQSSYDPKTGLFYQAVPGVGIDVFKPVPAGGVGQLVTTFRTPSSLASFCPSGPAGLAISPRQTLIGACDNGGIVVNLRTGHTQAVIPDVGGADEVWSNPSDGNVYFAQTEGASSALGVADAYDNRFLQSLPTGTGTEAHSVAAYSGNNQIFVPASGVGVLVFQSTGH